jgi:hypothetical protein
VTDQDDYRDKWPEISHGELSQFLAAKKVSTKCPHCSSDNWLMMEGGDIRGLALPTMGTNSKPSPRFMPVMPLVCTNCGYFWPIVRGNVQEWLEERELAEKDTGAKTENE